MSPESLLVHARDLLNAEPIAIEAFYDLFYPENERQRWWVKGQTYKNSMYFIWTNALIERFRGECLPPNYQDEVIQITSTSVKNQDGDRAEAEWRVGTHAPKTLHLVRIDGAWWISGYTFEYLPETDDAEAYGRLSIDDPEEIKDLYLEISTDFPIAARKAIAARVQAGEFADCLSANEALAKDESWRD